MVSMATTTDRPGASLATDDARWQAVARRDPAADGVFYYSVLTTGVYCRPSCAARLPRRENVTFHATCAAAECIERLSPVGAGTVCASRDAPAAARTRPVVNALITSVPFT